MTIHLIIVRQGSGKTLFIIKKAYEYHNLGYTIYSNVHLHFPYKKLTLKDIIECKLRNAVVIIDEIHLFLSSRNSMSIISREICDGFLSMVRKAGLIIYATTQTERKVDVRFREEKDFLYICTKYAVMNNKVMEILHNQNLPINVRIIIKMEIQEMFSGSWVTFSFIGNRYFNLFDTNQIIQVK